MDGCEAIMPKKNKIDTSAFITKNEPIFTKLYEILLWPIIQPLLFGINDEIQGTIKQEVWKLFYSKLQKKNHKSKLLDLIPPEEVRILDFISSLVDDFAESFYEEMVEEKDPNKVIDSLTELINQQIILSWIELVIEQTITPLLIFSLKSQSQITEAQQILAQVLLAIVQEKIAPEEAANQSATILQNNYNLSEEAILFIRSFIKTIGNFRYKNGLEELAKIGEKTLAATKREVTFIRKKITHITIEDPIENRTKILSEWTKNVLEPACIGLKIAGEKLYVKFIEKCKENFELFLDQSLSAADFEKRLEKEMKKFGGDDEELILPIRESIAGSVRFLELARIDDPSLSLLLLISDEEREGTKRMCL